MSKSLPPLTKARHLRLVPPLPPLGDGRGHALKAPIASDDANAESSWANDARGMMAVGAHVPQKPFWLRYGLLALLGTLAVWAATGFPPQENHQSWDRKSRLLSASRRSNRRSQEEGPSMQLYVKEPNGHALGRPLHSGDPLSASDELVLGLHNAPGPGTEAAQFAAVFALDKERNIAALYPALGANAVAMPLPQVAFMALFDGPQLSFGDGPITLVAVFLRHQLPLGPLMRALAQAPALPVAENALSETLQPAVVRLQSVTVTHGEGPG